MGSFCSTPFCLSIHSWRSHAHPSSSQRRPNVCSLVRCFIYCSLNFGRIFAQHSHRLSYIFAQKSYECLRFVRMISALWWHFELGIKYGQKSLAAESRPKKSANMPTCCELCACKVVSCVWALFPWRSPQCRRNKFEINEMYNESAPSTFSSTTFFFSLLPVLLRVVPGTKSHWRLSTQP